MTIPNRFVGGALDLAEIKARAEAREAQEARLAKEAAVRAAGGTPVPTAAVAPFFVVSAQNFEEEVARRSTQVPVIILVGSDRTAESTQLKALLEEFASLANNSFVVGYVDADTTPEIAQVFGVRAVPTVLALAQGQPVASFEGLQPREVLEQWVDALVTQVGSQLPGIPAFAEPAAEVADPRLQEAAQAIAQGNPAQAIVIYEDILQTDPKNTMVRRERDFARVLARLAAVDSLDSVVTAANAAPQDLDKALIAADFELSNGQIESAFTRLIALLPGAKPELKTQVRDRLVELFGIFEATDERVLAARAAMANALF
ncbi:tetratricopeptide repeat protein [Corynebacterium caspium]|uniref:tetratricopeptide repeat protein n=1 Tax=Corynebacterium caspium TaxID=234828 RepID=UPI00036FB3E5|nr:tetratricopeptide repeat protein [Corynebacterium caspium]WKD59441.1 Thioredoxin C-1 [Corynebacterium caspium DSM 44850]